LQARFSEQKLAEFIKARSDAQLHLSRYSNLTLGVPSDHSKGELAKELLRAVPAAAEADGPCSIRGALCTAFMKPENVIGALVYTDGNGNWWADVVLNKGEKYLQMGSQEEAPLRSYDDALEHVKGVIAYIKAMREHPLVQEFREKGCDPERVELLRIGHAKFGHRWMILDDDQIRTGAEAFVAYVADKFPGAVDTLEKARTVILQTAPQFATDSAFLGPTEDNDEQGSAIQLIHYAAAFVLRCGIQNVDQDTINADRSFFNREMISEQPTLH
jgi:hypothetical protein